MAPLTTLHVSPEGSDSYSGLSAQPVERPDGFVDGPLASLRFAIGVAREWRCKGQAGARVRISLADGHYPLAFPIELGPEDSGLVLEGAGAGAIIDGSVPLPEGILQEDEEGPLWEFEVSDRLLEGDRFNSLFLNGRRRFPSRFPHEGYLRVAEAPDRFPGLSFKAALAQGVSTFRVDPTPLAPLGDLTGARVILLNRWLIERVTITAWDAATGTVTLDRPTRLFLRPEGGPDAPGCRFFIEDLPGSPNEPGTWTIDRQAGRLLYRPETGESLAEADARVPLLTQFVRVVGDRASGRSAHHITLENLRFRYAEWIEPDNRFRWWDPYDASTSQENRESCRTFIEQNNADPRRDSGSPTQAAFTCPGAIHFNRAEDCELRQCEIAHVGFYAVGMARGCKRIYIEGNHFRDLGAGGAIAEGTGTDGPPEDRNEYLHLHDNRIEGTGQVFPAACGITVLFAARCTITHNHLHDLSYSGISVGWSWGEGEQPSFGHLIERNHIHDVGVRRGLSDMGGIYLLGLQPGTFVRHNHIHDVQAAAYGGWGIYCDEGSAGLTVENNAVVRCTTHCLHQNQGRGNLFRNNLFAYGGQGAVRLHRDRRSAFTFPPQGTTFLNNIFLTHGQPMILDIAGATEAPFPFQSDLNLFWDEEKTDSAVIRRSQADFGTPPDDCPEEPLPDYQSARRDSHSVLADPRCRDPKQGDFTFPEDSPALALGFLPLDLSDVGPRNETGPSAACETS